MSLSPAALKRTARKAFYRIFAYLKNVDVLGPTIVRELPEDSPYQRWLERAAATAPLFSGPRIDDVRAQALQPWPQLGVGVRGLYLRFADNQVLDGKLLELPAGAETVSQRHFYEQAVYCIGGSGSTTFVQEGAAEQRIDWREGDLFCVPLNVRHRHCGAGDGPARLLIVSSFPLLLNTFADEALLLDNPWPFPGRYDGTADYFRPVEPGEDIEVRTNLARDIRHVQTRAFDYRGRGNTTRRYLMAGNSMLNIHVSEMPPRAQKRAHRQSGEAFILILSGSGFSLAWPEGDLARKKRSDWQAGTLFSPPFFWYHQNMNPNPAPVRYLAINTPTLVRNLNLRFSDQLEVDPDEITVEWQAELAKSANPAD